jgi:hypothetical protein
MNNEPSDSAYEAPQVTEESFDSGGNYSDASSDGGELGTLGASEVDPPTGSPPAG